MFKYNLAEMCAYQTTMLPKSRVQTSFLNILGYGSQP